MKIQNNWCSNGCKKYEIMKSECEVIQIFIPSDYFPIYGKVTKLMEMQPVGYLTENSLKRMTMNLWNQLQMRTPILSEDGIL